MFLRRFAAGALAFGTVLADLATTVTLTNAPADALAALPRLRVAPGLKLQLWASEPLIENLTSVSYDHAGRAYVVETGRRRTSVFDVRNLQPWLEDDFALRTAADRAAFFRRVLNPGDTNYPAFLDAVHKGGKGGFQDFNRDGVLDSRDLEVEAERIRLLSDTDHDGRADQAAVFAEGFNGIVAGVAAGVLAEGTNVWFANIPELWRFPAAGPQGAPTPPHSPKNSPPLLDGFGVHIAFGGHDLHGLIKGPDGRIYFSIADRGTSVTNREGRVISVPDTGAVFRCEPDGRDFEVFATGLRNPQELAFDDDGNLWTADNNGDGGDKARWLLLLEGADYGWTLGWQWLPKMGAWNSERLWHPLTNNTAASQLPAVANIGHGPAGIAHYPGTGLGERFRGHFFYADFPGGIRHYRVEPDGAFFRVVQAEGADSWKWLEDNSAANTTGKVLWDLSPVDVTFPPFGGLIVADWVQGWEKTGKGRLWHVVDPALANDPAIAEVARLLGEGMLPREEKELLGLLSHRDQRVRLEAQWEAARRYGAGKGTRAAANLVGRLTKLALGKKETVLGRVHALWALAHLARLDPTIDMAELLPTLADSDATVRLQAVRSLGSRKLLNAFPELARLATTDPSLAIRAAAVRELGRYHDPRGGAPVFRSATGKLGALFGRPSEVAPALSLEPVFAALRSDTSGDPVLLAAAANALGHAWAAPGFTEKVQSAARDQSERVRLAVLLAERQHGAGSLTNFLSDPAPQLVLEAARAIHDLPVAAGLPALAGFLTAQPPLLTGVATDWPATINFTQTEWQTWILRRAVNAAFRLGGEAHARAIAELSLRPSTPEAVRVEALETLGLWPNPPRRDRVVGLHRPLPSRDREVARRALQLIWSRATGAGSPVPVLLAALRAGVALELPDLALTMAALNTHTDPAVQEELRRLRELTGRVTVEDLIARLDSGSVASRQSAFARLASAKDAKAVITLAEWAERLAAGKVADELRADVWEAAQKAADLAGGAGRVPTLARALTQWTNSWAKDDVLAPLRVALAGGDAANGRKLFAERADWGCQRCHKLGGEGGDVGPDLTGLGRTKGREYVLRAIVNPNAEIAPGYESVLLELNDDSTVVGVLREEKPDELIVMVPETGRTVVRKADLKSRASVLSAMPEGLGDLMTRRELRDLVEAMAK